MAKNQYAKELQAKKKAERLALRDDTLQRYIRFMIIAANRPPFGIGAKRAQQLLKNIMDVVDEWAALAKDDPAHADLTLERAFLQIVEGRMASKDTPKP